MASTMTKAKKAPAAKAKPAAAPKPALINVTRDGKTVGIFGAPHALIQKIMHTFPVPGGWLPGVYMIAVGCEIKEPAIKKAPAKKPTATKRAPMH